MQSSVFGVDGRDLLGEPAELASAFDNPYKADVARDGTRRSLEYRPGIRGVDTGILSPALDEIAEKGQGKGGTCAACYQDNTVELTKWTHASVWAFDGYRPGLVCCFEKAAGLFGIVEEALGTTLFSLDIEFHLSILWYRCHGKWVAL